MNAVAAAANEIPTWVKAGGGTTLAGLFFWLFAYFIRRKVSEEGTGIARSEAEIVIIQHLRDEVRRLTERNSELFQQLWEMRTGQIEILNENIRLRAEVASLSQRLDEVLNAQN